MSNGSLDGPKVLHVLDNLGMGGAETWLLELLRFWARKGGRAPRVDFLATGGKSGLYDTEAKALGARIFYLRYGRSHLTSFARGFREILKRGAYDAIHHHGDYGSGWHFWIGKGLLPPVRVTHVHNPSYQILNNYGVTTARRLTARIGKALVAKYATHIAGTSRQMISEYGFDDDRFDHITKSALHCGFDTSRFLGDRDAVRASICEELGWPENVKVILFTGRIDVCADLGHPQNHKNSGFAVNVGIECARRGSGIRMLLAGAPSPALPILLQRIADAGLAGHIQYGGFRRDVGRLMIGSDALLFPSRGEGLGMVAVEAQAAGLPVLASTSVPNECVVVPNLVRFKAVDEGVASWASELLQLVRQPRDMQNANRRVSASAFSIENSASALLRLYTEQP